MSVNGKVADDGDGEATSGEIEERIEDFKQDKARQKSSFTQIKNKLLRMVDEQDYPSRREKNEMCQQLSDAQERAVETMTRLLMEYALLKDREHPSPSNYRKRGKDKRGTNSKGRNKAQRRV